MCPRHHQFGHQVMTRRCNCRRCPVTSMRCRMKSQDCSSVHRKRILHLPHPDTRMKSKLIQCQCYCTSHHTRQKMKWLCRCCNKNRRDHNYFYKPLHSMVTTSKHWLHPGHGSFHHSRSSDILRCPNSSMIWSRFHHSCVQVRWDHLRLCTRSRSMSSTHHHQRDYRRSLQMCKITHFLQS